MRAIFAPLAALCLLAMSAPVATVVTPPVQSTTAVSLNDYLFVSTDGWVLRSPYSSTDVTDMRQDPQTGLWIWTDTGSRSIDDLIQNGGLQGIAVDYIAPAYAGMVGVQRNVDSGVLWGYASPGLMPFEGYASFPPNTMPVTMTLPILQPSEMATTTVTPKAVQAFPWKQVTKYLLSPVNCAMQSVSNLWTRNSLYLVASLPIGGTVGTPPLALILETEQTSVDPNAGGTTMRIERYAFVPGFGRVWQEQAMDVDTPNLNGIRSIWNIKQENAKGHLVGPLCPLPAAPKS